MPAGHVNANRKYEIRDEPTRVALKIPESLLHEIDRKRGNFSRNQWLISQIHKGLGHV